jgi:hypothetical protein
MWPLTIALHPREGFPLYISRVASKQTNIAVERVHLIGHLSTASRSIVGRLYYKYYGSHTEKQFSALSPVCKVNILSRFEKNVFREGLPALYLPSP